MKIIVSGKGRMGKAIDETAAEMKSQIPNRPLEIASFIGREQVSEPIAQGDIILDFSSPSMALAMANVAKNRRIPFITGTTGFTKAEIDVLKDIAQEIPLLVSFNFSLGIALFARIIKGIPSILGPTWDIELSETHHKNKVDAPSGTAFRLLEALDPDESLRNSGALGVHSLRGGTVIGEHTVSFFGPHESLSITHRSEDRKVFAQGALVACEKLLTKEAGFYTLEELMFK
ncbi:MAG: 4-hydroxy-tetrahydrodipicolinate reductase [Anaerovoracaceae bacterium]|nr:4-hydroxy-tetrahydrodipicolinate reductase [Anaerovoracaceae bacterium]